MVLAKTFQTFKKSYVDSVILPIMTLALVLKGLKFDKYITKIVQSKTSDIEDIIARVFKALIL